MEEWMSWIPPHRSRLSPEQGPPETKNSPSLADLVRLNERHWGLTASMVRLRVPIKQRAEMAASLRTKAGPFPRAAPASR
jgi:hypothetical protein